MNLRRFSTFVIFSLGMYCLAIFPAYGQTPDPGLPGTLAVSKQEYNLGNLAWKCPDFPDSVEVIGSVHYPTGLPGNAYPVIVFQHGRHETCYDTSTLATSSAWPCPSGWHSITSYEGYDYLATQMASHGYIVISISCNAINATDNSVADYGMQGRGELLQHHLDLWNTWNTSSTGPFGSTFVGKLNMQNIGTMGHSRGGEGVVFNALYNQSLGSPYGIHAVLTLAPVDFLRHVLHGIPLLDVSPYCDGDVNDIEGVHFYDDSRYTDTTDAAPKHTILLMGANHNFFNTVWTPGSYIAGGADDWLYSYPNNATFCGAGAAGTGRFDTTTQKAALNAYLSAFFRIYLGHENQFVPILYTDSLTPPTSSMLTASQVFVSYHASKYNRLDLNRTDSLDRYTTNTLAGAVTESGLLSSQICGGGFSEPDCGVTTHSAMKPHNGNATTVGLSQMGMNWNDTLAYYENAIPVADENVSAYSSLSFRTSVNYAAMTAGPNLNFSVALTDSAGNSARLVVGNYTDALFYQPGTQSGDLPKLLFNSVKIPLSGFTGVNMSKVRNVKFIFNKTVTGAFFFSDIMFTNPVCGTFTPAFTDSITHNTYKATFTNTSVAGKGDSLIYSWNFGQPASGVLDTSTLVSPTHTYSAVGTYTVCLHVTSYQKNSFICTDSICKSVVVPARTGLPALQQAQISIFPNPTKGLIDVTGAPDHARFALTNMYGQQVYSVILSGAPFQLPAGLPSGIYLVTIESDEARFFEKLILEGGHL